MSVSTPKPCDFSDGASLGCLRLDVDQKGTSPHNDDFLRVAIKGTGDQQGIKELLGMLARLCWGRRDMLGSRMENTEECMLNIHIYTYMYIYTLIVSCHWIKVFITA